ncbi:MAG: ABC transporter ATP-binding protein [Bacteroidales bacterium]|nr:ABC transporter ATP-binding protein [Bacteroidales bacterium]
MSMLSINNLTFSYDKKPVLDGLTFEVPAGDFCAVIGPNGSGKSTLLKAVSGLLPEAAVRTAVSVDGQPLSEYTPLTLARKVAYVPQRVDIVFDFTVFDTVMMGRHPHQSRWETGTPHDRAVVTEMLDKTGLLPLKDRMLTQLSGGEVQRVMIARAMAQQTPVLLLDEPLSNLDVTHKFEVMRLLRTLNREQNVTVLIVVHDFAFAKQFATTTLLLKGGERLAYGPTDEVITLPMIRDAFGLSGDYRLDERGNVYCD